MHSFTLGMNKEKRNKSNTLFEMTTNDAPNEEKTLDETQTSQATENPTTTTDKKEPETGPLETDSKIPETVASNPDSINTQENNQNLNTMDEPKKPEEKTDDKPKKPATKKEEPLTPVIKKDWTPLILAGLTLLVIIGVYMWQNYKRRKEDEKTIDTNHEEMNANYNQDYPNGI